MKLNLPINFLKEEDINLNFNISQENQNLRFYFLERNVKNQKEDFKIFNNQFSTIIKKSVEITLAFIFSANKNIKEKSTNNSLYLKFNTFLFSLFRL